MQQDAANLNRRATDMNKEPTLFDILQKLIEIQQKQQDHASAFLINDLGKPDYDGHRQAHKSLVRASEALEGYKEDATKKFIGIALGATGTLLSLGLLNWVQGHLK